MSEKLGDLAKKLIKYLVYMTIVCITSLSLTLLVLRATGVELNSLLGAEIAIIMTIAVLILYDYFERWKKGEAIEVFPVFFKSIGVVLLLFSAIFFETSEHDSEIFQKIFLLAMAIILLVGGTTIIVRVTNYEGKERRKENGYRKQVCSRVKK